MPLITRKTSRNWATRRATVSKFGVKTFIYPMQTTLVVSHVKALYLI